MNTLEAWLCLKSAPKLKIGAIHAILEKYPDPGEFVGTKTIPSKPMRAWIPKPVNTSPTLFSIRIWTQSWS